MRPQYLIATIALALGSAACVGSLETMQPGDDAVGDDGPDPVSAARTAFDTSVAPMLTGACASCHTGAIDTTPLKFLGSSGVDGYYAGIIAEPSVNGGFDPGLANMLNKGEHDGGNARAWAQTEKDAITEWLLTEADERGIDLDPTPPPPTGTTPTTSREALAQWSGCMSIDDWTTSQAYTWADKGSERGQCMSCHNQGAGGFYANANDAEMFEMNRYEIYITTFFTAAPVNVADPSLGYQVLLNEQKLRAKANATGHPGYNPDGGESMGNIREFYDLTMARKAAGLCGPSGFPEVPPVEPPPAQ